MLAVYCDNCEARQLLPLSLVLGVTSDVRENGRVVHHLAYRCWCGHRDVVLVRGPAARPRPLSRASVPETPVAGTPVAETPVARRRGLLDRLARVLADVRELHERRALLARPWEEEFLHWAHDELGWQLHGHLPPPAGRRRSSVTPRGWCPGLARSTGEPGS